MNVPNFLIFLYEVQKDWEVWYVHLYIIKYVLYNIHKKDFFKWYYIFE